MIDFKYEKLNKKDGFNVFSILRKKSDEVHLHSRFLFELLSTDGSHAKGDLFAQLFLETIDEQNFDLENYKVSKEHKNIDLLLTNDYKNQAIIIENKIWTGDQKRQLERYYKIIQEEGYVDIKLYYLTLFGDEPSDNSVGELAYDPNVEVSLISYEIQISEWIEKCIETSARNPTLREALIQYKAVISDLTGNSMGDEQRKEIIELLSQGGNAAKAKSIYDNWRHFKWHAEYDFWRDMKDAIAQEFVPEQDSLFSKDKITRVVHGKKNRNPWFGVMFFIGKYKQFDVRVYIERGDEDVYYGLVAFDGDVRVNVSESQECIELSDLLSRCFEWGREKHWIGGNYVTPRINFEKFADEATFNLANEEFREKYVQDTLRTIKEFVKNCQSKLSKINPQK